MGGNLQYIVSVPRGKFVLYNNDIVYIRWIASVMGVQ